MSERMRPVCRLALVCGFLVSSLIGVYLGGVAVMYNYAIPMFLKNDVSYAEYKDIMKNHTWNRLAVSLMWPLIVFEEEIPFDYDKGEIDPDP